MAHQFDPARLKRAREDSGFTQKALAAAVGVSYQTYQHWEHGRRPPRVDQLIKLAEVLGQDYTDFVASQIDEKPDDGA